MTKLIQKLKSKDGKILLENFFSLSGIQLISKLLGLFTLPYVLRVIGFEKYGIITFAASLILYFTSLTDFSFNVTAVRDVAIFKNSPRKLNLIYSKVIIIKSIFLMLSLLIITSIVLLYPPFYEYKLIYGLSMLSLIGKALFPEWFFQGIEKMRYIAYLNVGIKVLFTACIFIFINEEKDFWLYPLLQAAGLIVAGLVGQLIMVYKFQLKFYWLPKRIIWNTVRINFAIFINQFVPTMYNNTTTFLLGLLGTNTMVGIYNAILVVINLCFQLLKILSRVFYPFLNRKKHAFLYYRKMVLYIAIIMVACIIIGHDLIFWYLDITYNKAFYILLILAFGIIGFTLYDIFGLNYFIIQRQDKLVMRNTIRSSLIGFLLAFPLIYFFGIIGAAINLSLSRWLMGVGLYLKYRNR